MTLGQCLIWSYYGGGVVGGAVVGPIVVGGTVVGGIVVGGAVVGGTVVGGIVVGGAIVGGTVVGGIVVGGAVVGVGCGVGPIHVTCPVTGLIVRYDPTVSGGPLFVKLSVVTFEPDKLLITSELPLLGTSTPMPAIPHVHSRLAKGLFPGSKSPCGVPIIG